MRIEDTDKAREIAGADKDIIRILKTFGLDFDEGPIYQSKKLKIYQKYAGELVKIGAACEDEGAIRQKIPAGTTEFEDLVYGKIKIENRVLDEGILLKSDGFPVYNFANVIDDHEMGITHVIRGEEFIPSTPKHILLYQAFGWQPPKFAHLPLLLSRARKKLSKRDGDVAVQEYLDKGYLKEAMLNFIAFLGWNPKSVREIFTLEELIQEFSLEKVNKAGAVFDLEKLNFINREWQKKLNLGTHDPMYQEAKKLLQKKFSNLSPDLSPRQGRGEGEGAQFFDAIWPLIFERVKGPSDLEEKLPEFYFFFETPEYEGRLLQWKQINPNEIKSSLEESQKIISNFQFPISKEKIQDEFIKAVGERDKGSILWPLRVALSGLKNSPGPFDILEVLSTLPNGSDIINERIEKAIAKLDQN